jgi:aminocarboxymuconate-semialdehyde decarboxylase
MKMDLHTHYYPPRYFETVRDTPSDFSFGTDPTGRTIIRYRGARFFGVTAPMTDPDRRLEDMDRVGIDVEVLSLSTPNVFFADAAGQPGVARMVNDAYAELAARHPKRFKGFASIPMDAPDAALAELHRAVDELKLQGVILLSNIRGRALTDPVYRPFFEEADRMRLCIFLHPMLPAQSEPFNEYVLGPLVGFPFDTTLAVARMCFDGLFRDLPNIRWIIGHLGGAVPYLMERLDNGFRDFAECRAKIDERRRLSQAAELRHGDLQPAWHENGPQPRGPDHMVMGAIIPTCWADHRAVSSIEARNPGGGEARIFGGPRLILNNV